MKYESGREHTDGIGWHRETRRETRNKSGTIDRIEAHEKLDEIQIGLELGLASIRDEWFHDSQI